MAETENSHDNSALIAMMMILLVRTRVIAGLSEGAVRLLKCA